MALVVEDGTGKTDAETYATAEELRAFASKRQKTVPAAGAEGDATLEAKLVLGMDYLEGLRDRYQGVKATAAQALQWPRTGVTLDGYCLPADAIPKPLKEAQMELALAAYAGTNLAPVGDGREVIRKKIDVLETEYAPGSGSAPAPVVTAADRLLEPLLDSGSFGLEFQRV